MHHENTPEEGLLEETECPLLFTADTSDHNRAHWRYKVHSSPALTYYDQAILKTIQGIEDRSGSYRSEYPQTVAGLGGFLDPDRNAEKSVQPLPLHPQQFVKEGASSLDGLGLVESSRAIGIVPVLFRL